MWGGPITPALGKQRQGHEESSQFDLLTHTLSPLPTKQLANFLKTQQLAPVAVRSTLPTRTVVPSSTFQSKRDQQTCMLIPSELWRPAPLPYVTSLAIRLSYWAECGSPRPMPLTMSSLYQQTQHHLKLCTDATLAYCGLLSLGLQGQGPAMCLWCFWWCSRCFWCTFKFDVLFRGRQFELSSSLVAHTLFLPPAAGDECQL